MSPLLLALALALALPTPADAAEGCLAVTSPAVHLPSGPTAGTVIVRGGRVEAVLPAGVAPPADCAARAAAAVTPALIDPSTSLGLVEVSLEVHAHDDADLGAHQATAGLADGVTASRRAADAYNPLSTVIPVQRQEGVGTVVTVPGGGALVRGVSAHVRLTGATQASAVLDDAVAMHVSLTDPTPSEALYQLERLLEEARAWARDRDAWRRGASRPFDVSHTELEALQPVLRGELPLVVAVNRANDIEATLRMAGRQGLRLVLSGAREGWVVADQVAAAGVPVIVDPLQTGLDDFYSLHFRPDNAALLAGAGVKVLISTGSAHNVRKLRQLAGNAVREGLAHEDALAAITSLPAEVFGLSGRGRIEAGAVADLALWTGDPLELTTSLELLLLDGAEVPLVSRQTLLRDRYRNLPAADRP